MAMKVKAILVVMVCVASLPTLSRAASSAAQCEQARGVVEKLVCTDAKLAGLDRQLGAVYRAALAKAQGKEAAQLRAEQRGWIKGRNDCWKATQKTWITASWTVDTVGACVEAQYRLRTSELQAVWRLMPPQTVFYACQNNPANEWVANYFATDPATIRLERGDRTMTLWQVAPVGQGLYEGANISLVRKGDAMRVTWLDTQTGKTDELECKSR